MFGASFDATAAMHAVGIMENSILGTLRREEVERAGFRAESALHTCVGNPDNRFIWCDCFVNLSHRANRTPEVAVENEPAKETDRCRDGDHDVKEHPPASDRGRSKPESQPNKHHDHYRYGCLARQKSGRHLSSGIGQERIECPARTEAAAAVAAAVPDPLDCKEIKSVNPNGNQP